MCFLYFSLLGIIFCATLVVHRFSLTGVTKTRDNGCPSGMWRTSPSQCYHASPPPPFALVHSMPNPFRGEFHHEALLLLSLTYLLTGRVDQRIVALAMKWSIDSICIRHFLTRFLKGYPDSDDWLSSSRHLVPLDDNEFPSESSRYFVVKQHTCPYPIRSHSCIPWQGSSLI